MYFASLLKAADFFKSKTLGIGMGMTFSKAYTKIKLFSQCLGVFGTHTYRNDQF